MVGVQDGDAIMMNSAQRRDWIAGIHLESASASASAAVALAFTQLHWGGEWVWIHPRARLDRDNSRTRC